MKEKTIRQFTDTLAECNLLGSLLARILGEVNGRYLYSIRYNEKKNEVSLVFSTGRLHRYYTKKLRYLEFEKAITDYFEDFFLFATIQDFKRERPENKVLGMPYKLVDEKDETSNDNLPF